ncbi:MAG: exodeoxyribonuclease VII small subunit [Acidimicrobiales bacterium]
MAEQRRFEDLLAELEAVTDRLASGDVGIEEAADLYERAERLHREAAERLDAVRARVERLREPPGPAPQPG